MVSRRGQRDGDPIGRLRSDRDLVHAAAAGDREAWDALVDRHAQDVWVVARGHGLDREQASDVSLTTWLRCADHIGTLARGGGIEEWLVATAARESRERTAAGPYPQIVEPDGPHPDIASLEREP